MEAGMTAKVKSRELKVVCFTFGFDLASTLTVSILLFSALLLVGCNDQQSSVPPRPQVSMPPEAREAELLNLLERKFENPAAHFQLGQMYHGEGLWAKAEYHYRVALGFDPAHAGGHLPGNFALLESYRVLTLGLRFPLYKVLAQNSIAVSRTRQE